MLPICSVCLTNVLPYKKTSHKPEPKLDLPVAMAELTPPAAADTSRAETTELIYNL